LTSQKSRSFAAFTLSAIPGFFAEFTLSEMLRSFAEFTVSEANRLDDKRRAQNDSEEPALSEAKALRMTCR